ncbi:MAG TPA: class I SAM-dependent methyltransferase [Candidatus Eisenbacteria bacterium]
MSALRLQPWPLDREKRVRDVDAIFRRVAPRYDALTRLLSLGQDRRWKRALIARLPPPRPGAAILDLATGTAELPALLRAAGRDDRVVALDRSRPMLAKAHRKRLPGVRYVVGDLNAIPVAAGRFDAVLMGYGLRYPTDLGATLAAIHRALRPGGVFLSLDFGVPENPIARRAYVAYLLAAGTTWGALLHGRASTYWHIVESIRAYPGQRVVAGLMRDLGFERVSVEERVFGTSVILRGERA